MDSIMMYLHVKKTGNESVDPVKNLLWETNNGSESRRESEDQIIINVIVENTEEASNGTLMVKVSTSTILLIISVILLQF